METPNKLDKFHQILLQKPLKEVDEIFDNIKIIYSSRTGNIHKIIMDNPELNYEDQRIDLWILTNEYGDSDINNLTAYDCYLKLHGKVALTEEWKLISLDTINLPYNA